jgi:hypothetical protein
MEINGQPQTPADLLRLALPPKELPRRSAAFFRCDVEAAVEAVMDQAAGHDSQGFLEAVISELRAEMRKAAK